MVNKVILIGNVGKDPETKVFDSGTQMSKITLATSKTYKKDEEKVEDTQWHNVVFWRGLSKVVDKYVVKGARIYIEGEIQYRSYEDSDGNKKYITEIQATEMKMLSKRDNLQTQSEPKGDVDGNKADAPQDDDYHFNNKNK